MQQELEKDMAGKQSESTKTETPSTSKRIKNTFAPNCNNEYFVPATLFSLCKYGFPIEKIPEEAQKMVREFSKEHAKKCHGDDDKVDFPPFPTGPGIIY